jgi:hypothetical protein
VCADQAGGTELRLLRNSLVFLYPIGVVLVVMVVGMVVGFNPTAFVLGRIYFP